MLNLIGMQLSKDSVADVANIWPLMDNLRLPRHSPSATTLPELSKLPNLELLSLSLKLKSLGSQAPAANHSPCPLHTLENRPSSMDESDIPSNPAGSAK
jgi:hypothetical protein